MAFNGDNNGDTEAEVEGRHARAKNVHVAKSCMY